MQKLIICLSILLLFGACQSSTKLLRRGDYDAAIWKSVKKLTRNKEKSKEILVLQEAFKKANDRDKENITYLKKEGKPENWDDIFNTYSKMSQRQQMVKPLLPLYIAEQGREAHFDFLNYDDELIQAKKNATDYFYAHALSFLDRNNQADARQAYYELQKVKSLSDNYQNVDRELARAKQMGTSYVLFKMKNATPTPLPPTFESDLTKISLTELNTTWVTYHTSQTGDINYAYIILVNMKNINVSPEGLKESTTTETKTIPDGFDYVLDSKGNVKKDSMGNDIKIPRTKTLSCNVTELYQTKKAIISGTLDYINNSNGQLLKTIPIASENFFEYRSYNAQGDLNALKPETKDKLQYKPMPFPPSFDMLLQAGGVLKNMVKQLIYDNKNVIN